MRHSLESTGVVAGAFGFRISGCFSGKGFVEWAANLRSRWLENPYGDQGQFLSRKTFVRLGGFTDMPLMEDYELNRRLRKIGRIETLPVFATTSGRRWKALGAVRTTLINQLVIAGYHLGVPVEKLARFYRRSAHRS